MPEKPVLKFVCIARARMGGGVGPEHYVYDPARRVAKRLEGMGIGGPDEHDVPGRVPFFGQTAARKARQPRNSAQQ